jgi:hypothetical protein
VVPAGLSINHLGRARRRIVGRNDQPAALRLTLTGGYVRDLPDLEPLTAQLDDIAARRSRCGRERAENAVCPLLPDFPLFNL